MVEISSVPPKVGEILANEGKYMMVWVSHRPGVVWEILYRHFLDLAKEGDLIFSTATWIHPEYHRGNSIYYIRLRHPVYPSYYRVWFSSHESGEKYYYDLEFYKISESTFNDELEKIKEAVRFKEKHKLINWYKYRCNFYLEEFKVFEAFAKKYGVWEIWRER